MNAASRRRRRPHIIANSGNGEVADESTIRRRIRAIWQELNPG